MFASLVRWVAWFIVTVSAARESAAAAAVAVSHVAIDYPDEVIHWFAAYPEGQRKRKAGGPCPHVTCPHNATSVDAWGPDHAHYELVSCQVGGDGGCGGNCRGWCAAPSGFKELKAVKWRLLSAV